MSSARRRQRLAAAVVVASTGLVGVGWSLPAVAATASTLYVDNTAATCSDSGSGSQAQPFCSIQAGVDAAGAGQTVLVAGWYYREQVRLTHSGEPGRPIVVKAAGPDVQVGQSALNMDTDLLHGFVLDQVHDVTVQNFHVFGTPQEGILVSGSTRVVVDHNEVKSTGRMREAGGPRPGLRVTGASKDLTLSRNTVAHSLGDGIVVDPGVTGTVITTNGVAMNGPVGIRVADAPGTVITSNTVSNSGGIGVALVGGSDHATVENNIVMRSSTPTAPDPSRDVELSVSADSRAGTKLDYNLTDPKGSAYSWGGQTFKTPTELTAATGQGTHDLLGAPGVQPTSLPDGFTPTAASGATDSADATAPGELDTDLNGNPRVDDPQRANTGLGGDGYYDRGAGELPAYAAVYLQLDIYRAPHPQKITAAVNIRQNWPGTTTYTFDFGDGSAPVVSTDPQAEHLYTVKGSYTVTATAAGTGVNWTSQNTATVEITDPGPLVPDLRITAAPYELGGGPLQFAVVAGVTASPWPVHSYRIDYGDGTVGEISPSTARHSYQKPGDYQVTLTETDEMGRTASVTSSLHVAYKPMGYTPATPTRLLDTRSTRQRLGAGQSIDVTIPGTGDAAVLNVTAVTPSQAGYLSVYPTGNSRPATSNVNFTPEQNVPNLVTSPVGDGRRVTIYNFSGSTDVVVDLMGTYTPSGGNRFTALDPSRLLDTRPTGGVGNGETVSLPIRGRAGVPADATAVVLNLTTTEAASAGYLTAYPSGTDRPGTSNLNFSAGQTVANQVIVPIGADGKVSLYNHSTHTQVVADVFGYYSPSGSSLFVPTAPTRLVDTRTPGHTALGQGGVLSVPSGAPAGSTGAVLNITGTAPTAGGYLTVWADGAARPSTSNLNFLAGKTVPNHVTTPLGTNGAFDVYNFAGTTHVVADLFGYFTK
ncbi:PKD domain-containing protein [Kitasatospora sp. McL0602]|uniref:PKD domain-containing protein n=1 Tax=Kitasatospora sp. McL0602 TaxID=3439530 RepID=UPI003F8C4289